MRIFSIHFPIRLPDNTGWEWSLAENSARDAIRVGGGHGGILAELPISTLKNYLLLVQKPKDRTYIWKKALVTFENLMFLEQMEMF